MLRSSLVVIALLTASAAHAQQSDDALASRLVARLKEMNTAFDRHDSASVRRLLAPGYTSADPSGVYGADAIVERSVNNPIDLDVHEEILEPRASLRAAGDTAVLAYTSVMRIKRGVEDLGTRRSRVTTTFVRRGDRWLVASSRSEDAEP